MNESNGNGNGLGWVTAAISAAVSITGALISRAKANMPTSVAEAEEEDKQNGLLMQPVLNVPLASPFGRGGRA